MNIQQQAKLVDDGLIIYFSLSDLSEHLDANKKSLFNVVELLAKNPAAIVYVSTITLAEAQINNGKEFYPTLSQSVFSFRSNNLKADISKTIYSVKLTPINSRFPREYLQLYVDGINSGVYTYFPRLLATKNNVEYIAPFIDTDPEQDGELHSRFDLVGFDLIFSEKNNNVIESPVATPDVKVESLVDKFIRAAKLKNNQTDHVIGMTLNEQPDPFFTPTTVIPPKA